MHCDIKQAEFRNGRSQELSPRSRNKLWYYAKVYQYFLFKSNGSKTQMPKRCLSLKCINFMFLHTYIYTYLPTYMHVYIHILVYMHACIHTYVHTYIHMHIHSHIRTYVCTLIRTYIHTYIHSALSKKYVY